MKNVNFGKRNIQNVGISSAEFSKPVHVNNASLFDLFLLVMSTCNSKLIVPLF